MEVILEKMIQETASEGKNDENQSNEVQWLRGMKNLGFSSDSIRRAAQLKQNDGREER